jgi:hypothetical protein
VVRIRHGKRPVLTETADRARLRHSKEALDVALIQLPQLLMHLATAGYSLNQWLPGGG